MPILPRRPYKEGTRRVEGALARHALSEVHAVISSNSILPWTRDRLISLAFDASGLPDPDANQIAKAADFLCMELASLQSEKTLLHTIERTDLTLVPGTPSYALPDDTIRIAAEPNDILGTLVMASGRETPVFSMTRAAYQLLLDKTTTGTPSRGLVEQALTSVLLTLYPVPDATFLYFRYARVRLLRTFDDGNTTSDLAQRWFQYLVYACAHFIALTNGLSLERVGYLRTQMSGLKAACLSQDTEEGSVQFTVAYGRRDGRYY